VVYGDRCTVIVDEIEFVVNVIQCIVDGYVSAIILVRSVGENARYVGAQKKLKQQRA